MNIKTSELTGAALDWAVAKIEFPDPDYEDADRFVYVHGDDEFHFTPSTNWSQGGPIIEREKIALAPDIHHTKWSATLRGEAYIYWAQTPLIAAMRCYVASKPGDTIDIPEELTGETA
jgi:hypothetical protein